MESPSKERSHPTRKALEIAAMSAAATILFSLEGLVPMPLPFLRLGLANLVSLVALRRWGIGEALVVLILRVTLGGLFTGRFLQPVFLMGLGGGLSATVVMAVVLKAFPDFFSLIGVSLWGALAKNVTQMVIAAWMIGSMDLMVWFPLVLLSSLVGGTVVGILGEWIDGRLSTIL